jgi:hypothetical protein
MNPCYWIEIFRGQAQYLDLGMVALLLNFIQIRPYGEAN